MGVPAQLLRLCTVAAALSAVLGTVRGLPRPPKIAEAPAGAAACRAPEGGSLESDGVRWVSQEQARAFVGNPRVAFVDCRPAPEFESGHVAGSVHVPPEAAALEPATRAGLASAATVVTYCDAAEQCERSLRVAELLRRAGLPDVRVLEGGMPAWLERGYPAESGTCNHCEADSRTP